MIQSALIRLSTPIYECRTRVCCYFFLADLKKPFSLFLFTYCLLQEKFILIAFKKSKLYKMRFVAYEDLEKEGYIVHLEPEFMTSANAERFQGKNDMLDASAGALILQSFLDRKKVD